MIPGFDPKAVLGDSTSFTIGNVPSGMDAMVLALLAQAGQPVAYVLSDGQRMADLEQMLGFCAPEIPVLTLPGWDCLPYDRVSPGTDVSARRLVALSGLASFTRNPHPAIVLTTANAVVQRLPPRETIGAMTFSARPGQVIRMEEIAARLERNGFERNSTVREVGEFAVRGGILDVFMPDSEQPIRLDFFGDTLETIRYFDPATQRTTATAKTLAINPMSEVSLNPDMISRFRKNYLTLFGAATRDDALYQAISEGRRYAGMEHWLPLYYDQLETVFDYLAGFRIVTDHTLQEAVEERFKLIGDYYEARLESAKPQKGSTQAAPYKPIPPHQLYLSGEQVRLSLRERGAIRLSPFNEADAEARRVVNLDARPGMQWAATAAKETPDEARENVFSAAVRHIADHRARGDRVLVSGWSEGSLDRLLQVLAEHGLEKVVPVANLAAMQALKPGEAASAVLSLERGFESGRLVVIGEQDVLGDRLVRRSKRRKRAADFISEATSLEAGSIVVHAEHGIGRFMGLATITAAGAPHECLELQYAGGDKLFLPVENIELLSRYGSEGTEAQLDKLGGVAWQARKAKLKKRLLDMAAGLIKIAAERTMRRAPALMAPEGLYDEFSTRFPYDETDDQANAIDAVKDDLAAGRPMDRLVCGDVGFGKTEVALRAAFITAMNGGQVAVVVPTTLL
ncbi:MAG: transcription-repair coupling factor, partial [Rhizobiaceae bacterium]|nr:transcription-repair coupling factor [Rhizobiaceae bacterium]